jgi:hypothetical protein
MKKVLFYELEYILEKSLNYIFEENEWKENKIEKTVKNIIKEFNNKFYSDNFLSRLIHPEYCIFKHKRGKNDGNFCCKKITNNGDKDKYLCTIHNKNYISINKKNKIRLYEKNKNGNNKSLTNSFLNCIDDKIKFNYVINYNYNKNFLEYINKYNGISQHNDLIPFNIKNKCIIKDDYIFNKNNKIVKKNKLIYYKKYNKTNISFFVYNTILKCFNNSDNFNFNVKIHNNVIKKMNKFSTFIENKHNYW